MIIKQFTARQMRAETKKKIQKTQGIVCRLAINMCRNYGCTPPHQYDASVSASHKRLFIFFCLMQMRSQIIMRGHSLSRLSGFWVDCCYLYLSYCLSDCTLSLSCHQVLTNILQLLWRSLSASPLTGFTNNPMSVCPCFIHEDWKTLHALCKPPVF